MGNIDESDDQLNQLEELKQELNALKQSFNQELNDRKSIEFALQERLKELNCHNQISKLMANPKLSTFEVIEKIVQIIPPSWQFPEIAEAVVVVYDQTFQTPNYHTSKHSLVQDIKINGNVIGHVKVCYPDNQVFTQQIFLIEETDLLFSIAERIGNFIEKNEKDSVLRQSEERFRNLVETISEIIYEFAADGTIKYISPSVEKILGYQPKELIGQSAFNILHADDRPVLAERLTSAEIKGSSIHEYRFITKSGEIRWLSKSTTSIHKEGKLISRVGTLKDISEQKLAEESIIKANRLYAVISQVNQAIVYTRDKEKLLDQICSIAINFGKFRMAWIGLLDEESKTVKPAVFKGWEEGYLSHIKQISPSDSPEGQGPTAIALREGTYFVCNDIENDPHMAPWKEEALKREYRSSIALPIKQSGKVIASFNIYSAVAHFFNLEEIKLLEEVAGDISFAFEAIEVEKEREKAIQEVSKFRTITDQANYGSAISTLDGIIIYVNQEFARMHQREPEEVIGKNLSIFHNPEQMVRVEETIELLKLDGKFSAEEVWRTRKDGSIFPSLMNASIIVDSNNVPQFLSATAIDITELKQHEQALLHSEEVLNYAQEIANMGSWEFNVKTNGVSWSKNYYRLLDKDPSELPMSLDEIKKMVHPDDRDLFDLRVAEILETHSMGIMYFRLIMPDGKMKWIQSNIVPRFVDNELVALSGISIDITEKKLAEEEIKQQNERLNAIISAMPDLMFVVDKSGAYQEYYTRNQERLLAPEDRIIGTNVKDLFDAETADLHIRKINECIEQQNLITYEYVLPNENALLFFEARLTPLGDERVLSFIRDITDRKQKDIQIKKLSQAIEQSPVLVVVTDLNGSIEYVNEAFTTVTGYRQEEAIGKNPQILKSGQTEQSVYRDLWNTITAGKEWEGEWINRKKNGELYWESVSIAPIHDESGKITNYIAVKQDITQRKKDEQEIKELNASLERKIADRTAALAETNANLIREIEERQQISEALQVKTAELENFFNVALDLLCIADTSGNFIRVNKAWETLLGYTTSELEHRQFLEFVHPDDLQTTLNAISELSEQNPVINFTNRYHAKDGSYRYIEWHSSPAGNLIYAAARDITERMRAEEFEDELLQLSSRLTGISVSEIDKALTMALGKIGKFLGADRSYIFEFSSDGSTFSNTYEWCNEGIQSEIENLKEVPVTVFPMWMETIQKHGCVLIPLVKDLPDSWKAEREILEPQEIQSLIAIPMLTENKLIGFVGLDSVHEKKEYNSSEINILKVWSSMLSSLINNKRSEGILEQTRQNYETFFNTIDDFLWVLDEQGNIIHTNNTVKKRLEYSNEELQNQSVLMVHPPERREEAGRIVGEMLAGTSEFCPVPVVTKSGTPIPVETRVKAGFWNGVPVIFGVSKDISQISLSEKKFSTAFHANSAMMAISYFDSGEYVDINNAFLETMGYSREEIVGKTNRELRLFVDPDLRGAIIRKLARDIPVKKLEMEMRTKTGDIKNGLLSADSFYIGDRRCVLTVNIDITERVKAEEEAKRAREEAEQANMAKSEFLSRMSHELRTPMNAILGFAQLLEMGQLNAPQKKGVDHILQGGKHLLDLINEVLDISRIEAGKLSLSTEPVKLSEVLLEMIDTIQPLANTRQIQLILIDSVVNSEYIKADRQRLKQVLMNLINNAVKYNRPGGSISIRTEIMPVRNEKEYIRISVTDTGTGIRETDISKLFMPFERIGAEFTGAEGSGLGLTVVKKLMDAMHGEIGLESKFGVGSTFWIELQHVESQLKNAEKTHLSANPGSESGRKNGTILCIEDNASNIELVEQILSSQRPGIQLIVTTNGKTAVDLAVLHKPDLILLDLNLPDIHGKDVLTLLLADERTTDIPVIVISADAMPQQIEGLMGSGAKKYMTKPLDVVLFLKTIDMYIVS
ncbi:MAG: PAS domain S-box protein [Prolixibacteraceae bacterium]|nr:PAS domain S-box protein [Prolixibacteraceae bacterium]